MTSCSARAAGGWPLRLLLILPLRLIGGHGEARVGRSVLCRLRLSYELAPRSKTTFIPAERPRSSVPSLNGAVHQGRADTHPAPMVSVTASILLGLRPC